VVIYWYSEYNGWLYAFIVISLIPAMLPQKYIISFQLSSSTQFYKRIGVKFILRFVQDGILAKQLTHNNNPEDRKIKSLEQAGKYLSTIMMYERFHLTCFAFFVITSIHSALTHQYWMAALIFLVNIIYNVCPLLLQQYNKLRVQRLFKRHTDI
jgi:hypothetical protein